MGWLREREEERERERQGAEREGALKRDGEKGGSILCVLAHEKQRGGETMCKAFR